MASIHKELEINAPAEDVWDAVRDVGAVRERIVTMDDHARRLVYAVVDWRTTHHNASFQVVPGDTGCRLVWITDLLPDSLAALVNGFVEQGCVAIRQTLETARSRQAPVE